MKQGRGDVMELQPHASERFQVSGANCLPRWRPTTEYMGHGAQQVSPVVGMVGGGGTVASSGGGSSESKFMVDDSVLTDLLDLDPLNEQLLVEAWMGGGSNNNNHGSEHGSFVTTFPPVSTTALPTSTSHMYPHANATMAASSVQGFQQEYLLHDSSQQQQPPPVSSSGAPFVASQGTRNMSPSTPGVGVGSPSNHMLLSASAGMIMPGGANRGGFVKPSAALEFGNVIGEMGNHGDDEKSSLSTVEGKPVSSGNVEAGCGVRSSPILLVPPSLPLRDRILQALRFIARARDEVLVQSWMPVMQGNRRFLLTREQPYVLEHKNDQLWFYRSVSETYEFPTEKTDGNVLGLPGRVFALRQPEWTPNVQFYTSLEYLRVKEAQRCDIRGSLAVPVLDQVTRQCLAVIELVGRAEKVQYGPDVDIIARALQVCAHFHAPVVILLETMSTICVAVSIFTYVGECVFGRRTVQ